MTLAFVMVMTSAGNALAPAFAEGPLDEANGIAKPMIELSEETTTAAFTQSGGEDGAPGDDEDPEDGAMTVPTGASIEEEEEEISELEEETLSGSAIEEKKEEELPEPGEETLTGPAVEEKGGEDPEAGGRRAAAKPELVKKSLSFRVNEPKRGAKGFKAIRNLLSSGSSETLPKDMPATIDVDGMLPEDTELSAESVDPEELELPDLAEGESPIVAYDITLSSDGDDYQPEDDGVTVTITNDAVARAIEEGRALSVWHVPGEGDPEPVDSWITDDGAVAFTAYGFSVYAVIGEDGYSSGDVARVTYEFYREDSNGEFVLWDTQILKDGEELIEPGIPTIEKPGYFFSGWYEGKDHSDGGAHAEITFGPVSIPAGTTQDRVYQYHAHYAAESVLVFWNASATDVIDEKEVELVEGGVDIPLSGVTPNVGANEGFFGWILKDQTYGDPGVRLYDPSESFHVDAVGMTELKAVVRRAYKIEFNENAEDDPTVTFTDPIMVPYGEAPNMPADPTRTGYTFNGWYTDPECTEEFDDTRVREDSGSSVPEIVSLYAGWTAEYTTYTLYVWREAYDASGDPATSHYELAASFLVSRDSDIPEVAARASKSGETINTEATWKQVFESSSYATSPREDTNAFDYRYYVVNRDKTDGDVEIRGDGSTIVNAYYDLKEFTMVFNVTTQTGSGWNAVNLSNAKITVGGTDYTGSNYRLTVKLGQSIVNEWPVTGSARSTGWGATDYTLMGWDSPYVPAQYSSLTYSTKQPIVTKELISNTSGVPQNTTTYNTRWTDSTNQIQINYYFERLGTDDINNRNNYDLSEEYSQKITVNTSSPNVTHKSIEGFEFNSSISSAANAGGNTRNFYYYRTTWNLVYHNYAELTTDTHQFTNIKFGTDISGDEYRYEPTPEAAGLPSYYRFMGWYTERNYAEDSKYNFTTMPNGNVALYAKWVPNGIQVTFDAAGGAFSDGSTTKQADGVAGSTIDAPESPTRDNYNFSHWVVRGSDIPVDFGNRVFTEDTTIDAVWTTSDEYSIVYERAETGDPGHSTLPSDDSKYRYGSHVELLKWEPGLPEEDHFLGWTVKKSGTLYTPGSLFEIEDLEADVYESYAGLNNVIVFVATYGDPEPEAVGITYVAKYPEGEDETFVETELIAQNLEFKAKSASDTGFECEGYEFVGWAADESDGGLKTEDEIAGISIIAPGKSIAADENGADEVTIDGKTVMMNYLYGVWKAAPVKYTVWHMFQDPSDPNTYSETYYRNGVERSCEGHEHEALTGSTAEVTRAEIDDYLEEGYEYNAALSELTGTVLADGSLCLYVYYDLLSYRVTYHYENDVAGETPSASEIADYDTNEYFYGEKVYFKADATAEGYEFSGWSVTNEITTGTDGTGRYFVMPHRNVTVSGRWTAKTDTPYTVEYYFQNIEDAGYTKDDSKTKSLTGTTGATVNAPQDTFEGFTLNLNADGTVQSGTVMGDGKLVLKLYYDRESYTVTYRYLSDVPGESALPAEATYKFGETVALAAAATAPGYNFTGWTTTDAEVSGGSFTMPAKNVTISGDWTVGKAKVTIESYYMDLEGNYPATPDNVHEDQKETGSTVSVTPQDPEGFTFDTTAENVLSATVAGDGSTTLKIYYARNKYNVTYVYNGHIPTSGLDPTVEELAAYTESVYYGATVTVKPDAVAEDYTFNGWRSSSVTPDAGGQFTMPAGDVRFIGTFEAGEAEYIVRYYKLKANDDGSGTDNGETVINGHEYELLSESKLKGTALETATADDPHYTGYTVNWDDTMASGFIASPLPGFEDTERVGDTLKGMIRGDSTYPLILALYLTPNEYSVSYAYSSDSVITPSELLPDPENYRYGDTVSVEPDPAEIPAGYTFRTWKVAGNVTDVTITDGKFQMPNRAVTLYGKFTAKDDTPYTVEYYFQNVDDSGYTIDGTKTKSLTGTTGSTVNAPQDSFEGFTLNLNADGTVQSGTVEGDGSLVLKLYYDRESYKVTYRYTTDVEGESALPAEATYKFGETVAIADAATAPGYTFTGWTTADAEVNVNEGSFTMPAKNVTVTGGWTNNSGTYTVWHYFEQPNGSYSVDAWSGSAPDPCPGHETSATTGTKVNAAVDSFTGYVHSDKGYDTASGTVYFGEDGKVVKITDANGDTVKYPAGSVNAGSDATEFRIYYDLVGYDVTYQFSGTSPARAVVPEKLTGVKYGSSFNVYEMAKDDQGATLPYAKGESFDGYIFGGWETKHEGVEISSDNMLTMPSRNVTLIGKWTPRTDIEYTVEHYLQIVGATDLEDERSYELQTGDTQTFNDGTTGATVTVSSKTYEGFTFRADLGLTEQTKVIAPDPEGHGPVFRLFYTRNVHKVTYVYEGTVPETAVPAADGLAALGGDRQYGESVSFADPAAAPGYTFSGWKTNFADANQSQTFEMPDRDVSVRGSFIADDMTYTIRYLLEDPNAAETAESYKEDENRAVTVDSVTGADAVYDGYDVEIEGYEFEKAEYADDSQKVTVDSNGDPTQVISLYYKAKTYSVVYRYENTDGMVSTPDPANPAVYNDSAVPFGKIVELAADASAAGYEFSGWKACDATGAALPLEADGTSFRMPAGNVDVFGSFKAVDQDYTIKLYYMQSDGYYPENDAPNWSTVLQDKTGTTVTVPDELYDPALHWDELSGKDALSANVGDYRPDASINDSFRQTVVKPDDSDELKVYFNLMFTVTYTDGVEDEDIFEDRVTEGLAFGSDTPKFEGEVPDREGYVFKKWDPEVSATVTADTVYTAVWAEDKNEDNTGNKIPDDEEEFTVLYKKGDHGAFTEDEAGKTRFEKLALGDATPEYAGELDEYGKPKAEKDYTFKNWRDRRGDDLEALPETVKAEDSTVESIITYTAVWADDKNNNGIPDDEEAFTVVYTDGVDNAVVFEDEVHKDLKLGDETPAFEGKAERNGYTFSGWNKKNGTAAPTVKAEDSDKNGVITYTAQWTQKSSGGGTDPVFIDDHVNYIIGYEDGSFRPEGNITRAETSAIFFRLLKEEVRNRYLSDENSYSDVSEEQWFNTYVSTLSEMGIFKGYADGSFLPGNPITRAEFAVIAGRFSSSQMDGGTYKFSDIDDHWAASDIRKAAALGYINGYETGEYKPDKYISRAEAVVVINRMLGRDKVTEESFKDYLSKINEFNDLSENAWYYCDVVESANDHDYKRAANGYETWTRRKPDIDWTTFQY